MFVTGFLVSNDIEEEIELKFLKISGSYRCSQSPLKALQLL